MHNVEAKSHTEAGTRPLARLAASAPYMGAACAACRQPGAEPYTGPWSLVTAAAVAQACLRTRGSTSRRQPATGVPAMFSECHQGLRAGSATWARAWQARRQTKASAYGHNFSRLWHDQARVGFLRREAGGAPWGLGGWAGPLGQQRHHGTDRIINVTGATDAWAKQPARQRNERAFSWGFRVRRAGSAGAAAAVPSTSSGWSSKLKRTGAPTHPGNKCVARGAQASKQRDRSESDTGMIGSPLSTCHVAGKGIVGNRPQPAALRRPPSDGMRQRGAGPTGRGAR